MTDYYDVSGQFGEVFDRILTKYGLINNRVAEALGVNYAHVSRMRRGLRTPSMVLLHDMCHKLPIDPIDRDVLVMAAMGGPFDAGLSGYVQGRRDAEGYPVARADTT